MYVLLALLEIHAANRHSPNAQARPLTHPLTHELCAVCCAVRYVYVRPKVCHSFRFVSCHLVSFRSVIPRPFAPLLAIPLFHSLSLSLL